MSIDRLVRLCLVMSFCFWASASFGTSQIFLHPIELVGYEGQDLRLKVSMPCGGIFFGIIAHEGQNNTLELAAAVRQDAIVCAGVAQPLAIRVGFLNVHRYDSIAPMMTGAAKRLEVQALESLYVGVVDQDGATLIASSKGSCRRSIGALLKPSREGHLYIGMVGLVGRGKQGAVGSESSCASRVKQSKIRVLNPEIIRRIRPLENSRASIARQYELRFAKVDMSSVQIRDGQARIRYFRSCQEAPIGLVFRKKASIGTGWHAHPFEIGVLVARYFNAPCNGLENGGWAEMAGENLSFSSSSKFEAIPLLQDNEQIAMRSLVAIETEDGQEEKKAPSIKLTYSGACLDKATYITATRSRDGHAAVGIVSRTTTNGGVLDTQASGHCSVEPQVEWLTLDVRVPEKVYPLLIRQ